MRNFKFYGEKKGANTLQKMMCKFTLIDIEISENDLPNAKSHYYLTTTNSDFGLR